MKCLLLTAGAAVTFFAASMAHGADMPVFTLHIKDHKFQPTEITAPANTKFKVLVVNHDSTASEFESADFNREKIVLPNSSTIVFIGPLEKGHYKFFDDFHRDTGNGVLIVQ
jgi:plastocyanin